MIMIVAKKVDGIHVELSREEYEKLKDNCEGRDCDGMLVAKRIDCLVVRSPGGLNFVYENAWINESIFSTPDEESTTAVWIEAQSISMHEIEFGDEVPKMWEG